MDTEQELLANWELLSLRIANLEDEIGTHRSSIKDIQAKLMKLKWGLRVGSIVRTKWHGECKVESIPFFHGANGKPTICISARGHSVMLMSEEYEIDEP